MRLLILFLVIFSLSATLSHASDIKGSLLDSVKTETVHLADESRKLVTTPLDWEGYGMLGTLAAGGAVGLTYIYDSNIRDKVQGIKSKNLDHATDIGSILGDPYIHLGLAAAVYGGGILAESPKYKELGEMLGEAAILADATTLVFKEAIGRERPFHGNDKGSFRSFQFKTDYDSLPSMHTASSFAMASVLASTSEQLLAKLGYYAAAGFVGFSRIYQDKHWASDIVLGAAVGELCGTIVTSYHADKGGRRLALVPSASGSGAGLLLQGRW